VTAVVTMLKVSGDKINNSRNANPKKLLNKPNKWLNLKKKALNRPKKHLKRLRRSIDDDSKGLRVLLDKASSSDLLFIKKGSQKYIPTVVTSFSSKKDPKSTYLP